MRQDEIDHELVTGPRLALEQIAAPIRANSRAFREALELVPDVPTYPRSSVDISAALLRAIDEFCGATADAVQRGRQYPVELQIARIFEVMLLYRAGVQFEKVWETPVLQPFRAAINEVRRQWGWPEL